MNRSIRISVGIVAAVLLGAAGCSTGPTLAEVSGTLTQNGKPLGNVEVQFLPESGKMGAQRSRAVTDERGHFTLVCDNGKPGAVVGPHVVLLRDLDSFGTEYKPARQREDEMERNRNQPPRKPRFGPQYGDVTTTPLKKEVNAGGPQVIDLNMMP